MTSSIENSRMSRREFLEKGLRVGLGFVSVGLLGTLQACSPRSRDTLIPEPSPEIVGLPVVLEMPFGSEFTVETAPPFHPQFNLNKTLAQKLLEETVNKPTSPIKVTLYSSDWLRVEPNDTLLGIGEQMYQSLPQEEKDTFKYGLATTVYESNTGIPQGVAVHIATGRFLREAREGNNMIVQNEFIPEGITVNPIISLNATFYHEVAYHALLRNIDYRKPSQQELAKEELAAPPEKKWILPRISEVFTQTQIPVVLHIDDIENIAKEDQAINASLLNLMAGVRGSGFFVLASTNHPEKINPQLLQPQRFAQVIHFGLPEEEARLGILDVHAQRVSRELEKPLFRSTDERDIVLTAIAKETPGFTARFLAEICTEAKSFCLQRIARLKNKRVGLREQDLEETDAFSIEDWEMAFAEVVRKYDRNSTVKRDKELQEFAKHYNRPLGYPMGGNEQANPTQLRRRIDEIAAQKSKDN